jgi:hypothetical protein
MQTPTGSCVNGQGRRSGGHDQHRSKGQDGEVDSRSKGGMDHGISPLKLTQLADEAGFSNSP